MMNVQSQISDLEDKIKVTYPGLKIGYSYDAIEDYYHIWHTSLQLQFEDDDFSDFIGGLIRECFYSKDIFNFSFGYNYLEDEKSKSIYGMNTYLNNITFNIGEMLETQDDHYYQLIKNYNSLNWSNFDSITISSDAIKDLSSYYKSIRQAQLKKAQFIEKAQLIIQNKMKEVAEYDDLQDEALVA